MQGWDPEDFHERDASDDRPDFETAALTVGAGEAARAVQRAYPSLGRSDRPDGVAFTRPRHGHDAVTAEVVERPGRPGALLRYRVAYRTGPPLSMHYPTTDGAVVYRVLEPYVASPSPTP